MVKKISKIIVTSLVLLIYFISLTPVTYVAKSLYMGETRFETNKPDKIDKVKEGGWVVAFGREITETDMIEGVITAIVAPEALETWFSELMRESEQQLGTSVQKEFSTEAQKQAGNFAKDTIRSLLSGKSEGSKTMSIAGIDFKAGVAEYSGHNQINLCNLGGCFWQTSSSTLAFQPYIAMRINKNTPPSPPSKPGEKPRETPGTPATGPATAEEAQMVEASFQEILGHSVGKDLQHWVQHMRNVGYDKMRQDASNSEEGKAKVTAAFKEYYGRDPTSTEIAQWALKLGQIGYQKTIDEMKKSSAGTSTGGVPPGSGGADQPRYCDCCRQQQQKCQMYSTSHEQRECLNNLQLNSLCCQQCMAGPPSGSGGQPRYCDCCRQQGDNCEFSRSPRQCLSNLDATSTCCQNCAAGIGRGWGGSGFRGNRTGTLAAYGGKLPSWAQSGPT